MARRSRIAIFVLLAATGAQAASASTPDRTPPTFGGLKSATTCIPGPVGGDRMSSYRLTWAAAKDNVTPSSRIVYNVYRATSPGGENFSAPTYTTRRGAVTFVTPPLSSNESNYFVVRARDAAGNRDRNRREQLGKNLCL
jgi:hypothetical protein